MRTIITTAKSGFSDHPRGLYLLFFAELWERFGFYSVQALLVLFMVKHYGYSDPQAYAFFGALSALLYASPVIGGYIADKILGFRHSILLGAIFYILAYIGLAIQRQDLFYVSLGLLIAGSGFFKSSVSTLLGQLYGPHDSRRDSGFTIFYMGINIGALLAPILCTYAATKYGWGFAFGLAAIGLTIAFIACLLGFHTLGEHGLPPKNSIIRDNIAKKIVFYAVVILSVWGCGELIKLHQFVNKALVVFGVILTLSLIFLAFSKQKNQRNKLLALLILMVVSIAFWALYFQLFLSITLFSERCADRVIFGYEIPTGMLASGIGFCNVLTAPFFTLLWFRLGKSRWCPSNPMKFTIGLGLMSAMFLLLAAGNFVSGTAKISLLWLFLAYLITSCGEMCLSPIGLSIVTALAPANLVGMIMGVWFMTLATGYAIAGYIAQFASIPVTVTNVLVMKQLYNSAFMHYGLWGLALCAVVLALTPWLKSLMGKAA